MRRYSYQKNKNSRKEKIGFFTAFSICLVAVGLALWSTYSSIGGFENANVTEPTYEAVYTPTQQAGQEVTGITVEETEPQTPEEETAVPEETSAEPETETTQAPEAYSGDNESLQTVLQVNAALSYPVGDGTILKEYSEDALYSETMGDYRAHTGVDFKADAGENVLAMADGTVEEIYSDGMYGNVIKVKNGNFSVYYCGVSDTMYCVEGSPVTKGDIIAKVGEIPCESKDSTHIHIEVRVGDKIIDPMMVISTEE